MKLGDNIMAPVEACSVWSDVCPRKSRPPKIGDIPRHVAVDEESPGSSGSRSVSQARESLVSRSMLDRSTAGVGCPKDQVKPGGSRPVPVLETLTKPPLEASRRKVERVPRVPGESELLELELEERAESLKRSLGSSPSIPLGAKASNGPCSIFNEISGAPTLEKLERIENLRRTSCAKVLKSIGETDVKFQEDDNFEDIIQVRKDSALYLDERSGDEAAELRDSLLAVGVGPSRTASIGRQHNVVDEALNSRLSGPRARRESSGYFSNLGTFDEDRWNSSTCPADPANQQDGQSPLPGRELHRERRRSSTKNRLPMGGGQQPQVNRMTTLVCPVNDDDTVISPADKNDAAPISGLAKTGRVEMPNIDEQSSLEINRSVELDRTDDNELGGFEAQRRNRLSRILDELSPESDELQEDKLRSDTSTALQGVGEPSRDAVEATKLAAKLGSVDLVESQWSSNVRAANRPRGRTFVHQYSSPNITNTELERIVERPHSENFVRSKTEQLRHDSSKSVDSLASPTSDCEDDDNELVVSADLGASDGNNAECEADPRKLLPRSIKVYQLLSTQSEDRGDGDARLFDRRISLQITRPEEETSRGNTSGTKLPTDSSTTGSEYPEEKKLIHADSVPILKIPSSESSTAESDLRLCAGGRKSGSNNPSGPTVPGIRPIYPYCPYSPYASPQGSPRTNRRRPLRESRRVSIDSRQGELQLNQYKLLNNIGQLIPDNLVHQDLKYFVAFRASDLDSLNVDFFTPDLALDLKKNGSYGIVKLAYNEEDETHYAMKILSKKKLMKKAGIFGRIAPGRKGVTNPLAKVYREIALLKKLDHPNVVKLVEVLDDPDEDNLYLVFELVQKGEVLQLPTDKPLDEETARINFRDVVMGVEYLHYQRIVHRDIKPSNLLVDSEGRVKVADLGVSAELRAAGELLSGSAGTPAFAAPETTTPGAQYSGTLCDVWSMGVTLYSLVTGKVPWDGAGSIVGVQSAVRSEPLRFPESPCLSGELQDLVSRMLSKDPARRITLAEIKEHSWLTNKGAEPLPNEADNCRLPVTVTDEEVARVVTRVPKLDTLILIKTMLKQHSFQNPFLPRRIVRSGCMTGEPGLSGANLKQQMSSDTTDSSTELLPIADTLKSKTEQFHKAGRSNSAPDSYEWQSNGRQISSDSLLPPVTESSSQEQQAEVEKR